MALTLPWCQYTAWSQQSAPKPAGNVAQSKSKEATAPGKPGEESAAPAVVEAPVQPAVRTGDVLMLKSGKVLSGGQVVRSSPKAFFVQLGDSGAPLEIPRRMVNRIDYDDIDPLRTRRESALQESTLAEGEMLAGERLSPELSEKLNTIISSEPVKYDKRDFVNILEELSKSVGVAIDVHESVLQIDGAKRLWTAEIAANTTLMSLVQVNLLKSFDELTIRYLPDGILVTTKAAAAPKPDSAPEPPE